jgi:arylformamidase
MIAKQSGNSGKVYKDFSAEWIDVSVVLKEGMPVWPGDHEFRVSKSGDMSSGDPYNVSWCSMSLHAGTHMDAPRHFIREGSGIDRLPLETVIGVARVIEIFDSNQISAEELARHDIREGERLLFKTRNSSDDWTREPFRRDYVYLSSEAAKLIANRRVSLVGADYLSVSGYEEDPAETHRLLLNAGVWIIEGLFMVHVQPGDYELICLPLKLENGDGAPARAVLRPLSKNALSSP